MCKVLSDLVRDLLGVCHVLSRNTFMPGIHPAPGTDNSSESWSVQNNCTYYQLLVILEPPPGCSFSLDTTRQLPARCSGIRVLQECTCSRQQLLGNTLCFLHPAGNELLSEQSWNALSILCTGSYLDMEKIAYWVQMLVREAWWHLPQSYWWQLTVLPSRQSCRFQLTTPCEMQTYIELVFAVQQGSTGTYPSLQQAVANLPSSTA
ncbi:PREDICTED: inositol 1,4,5-trisphosphate receptor-interacting protein-like 1 [Acanthisitta chloris]|uniref:inositol 1,4,5-trisphosphate receptor-interacting protein-like 1 n=1 Tax=Acanthisitta chloris TaxID=57068 RepID=UPI0004F0CE11|nr:PREDICTED: inositol 1,4,5-trisphosphate receptor-interacting protein-like 1 [Acanthisitta chloris]